MAELSDLSPEQTKQWDARLAFALTKGLNDLRLDREDISETEAREILVKMRKSLEGVNQYLTAETYHLKEQGFARACRLTSMGDVMRARAARNLTNG